MYQICAFTALCTVTGHQNKCLGHYLTQYFALLRIGCSYDSTYIAVGITHTVSSPGCYLFSYQLIQRSAVHQLILELAAAGIGSLHQYENTFFLFLTDLHKRIYTVGSQIRVHGYKIFIKTVIALAAYLYFAQMSYRVCFGSGSDIAALDIADDDQAFFLTIIHSLLKCHHAGNTELLIHCHLRLHSGY